MWLSQQRLYPSPFEFFLLISIAFPLQGKGWSGLRDSGRLQMGLHLSRALHPLGVGMEASLRWAHTHANSWCVAK